MLSPKTSRNPQKLATANSSAEVATPPRSRSAGRVRVRVNCGDSGSSHIASGTSVTSGSTPNPNRSRNPYGSSSPTARIAASTPPTGKPASITALSRLRRAAGATSTTSAIAVGAMPPNPRPARNRNTPSSSGPGASAAPSIITENQARQPTNTRRLPSTSVSQPALIAPTSMPSSA